MKALVFIAVAVLLVLSGCGGDSKTNKPAVNQPQAAPNNKTSGLSDVLLKERPAGAKDVGAVKKAAKEGDEVVIRGQIGGLAKPFTEGRAMMVIASVDVPEMKSCNLTPEDECKMPWDFCCVPQDVITANTATVQVLDKDGKALREPLEGLNGLKPLDVVVVKGTVGKRPDEKMLIVNAGGIFIERK